MEPHNKVLYDRIPFFEDLGILRRDGNGEAALDVPALTFGEWDEYWLPALAKITGELRVILHDELESILNKTKNNVPKHVDEYQYFIYEGALGAYNKTQILAIIERGLMPYSVVVGKTPVIFIRYKKSESK